MQKEWLFHIHYIIGQYIEIGYKVYIIIVGPFI